MVLEVMGVVHSEGTGAQQVTYTAYEHSRPLEPVVARTADICPNVLACTQTSRRATHLFMEPREALEPNRAETQNHRCTEFVSDFPLPPPPIIHSNPIQSTPRHRVGRGVEGVEVKVARGEQTIPSTSAVTTESQGSRKVEDIISWIRVPLELTQRHIIQTRILVMAPEDYMAKRLEPSLDPSPP